MNDAAWLAAGVSPSAVDEMLVRCRVCKVEKPISEMAKDRRTITGYISRCASCKLVVDRAYKETHRQQIRERDRLRYPPSERRAEERRRFAREHPDVVRAAALAQRGTDKVRARDALRYAVRSGRIAKPSSCQDCGRSDLVIHGHHHDYAKPLEVVWVCRLCHSRLHRLPDVRPAS